MSTKVYIVTLHRREDLPNFYADMAGKNIRLSKKRPISRNTNYHLTEAQAAELREDPRVWGVEAVDDFVIKPNVINREPYGKSGNFWKADTQGPSTVSSNDLQWGHIHCAGTDAQRGKGAFGPINQGWGYEQTNDDVQVFNNGRHVDVVIVDDPISYDSEEWYSPSKGSTRFVQYQWFNELNTLVNSIDDDGQTEPTGTIQYHQNGSLSRFHGNHVCGTVAGQHYGWANEANIYNIAVTAAWQSGQQIGILLIFDYLRAFHRTKGINNETGRKNPTVTNHSYSGIRYMPNEQNLQFGDLNSVTFRGVTYNSGNPGPSGWNQNGVEDDFGVRFNLADYPSYSAAVAADVQDAIEEGIIIVGSAGNDNLLVAEPEDPDWDNVMNVNGVGTFYYNRGGWPNTPDAGGIITGALNKQADFRKSTYSNFGPGVTLFSPGDNILSAYGNSGGLNDNKYSQGSGNFFYPIQGTSMASPQVCGVIACLATGKLRFNQEQAYAYTDKFCKEGDMTFDINGGTFGDNTARKNSPNKYLLAQSPRPFVGYTSEVYGRRKGEMRYPRAFRLYSEPPSSSTVTHTFSVTNSGASHYVLNGSDRVNSFTDANDPTLNITSGDKIIFQLNVSGHPFLIKTAATTGTGNQLQSYQGSGYGVLRNGSVSGDVTVYTEGLSGTFYYVCQFHGGMQGTININ
tara:strand:- start:10026 stop:12074 length:2049 start_codon:yes stop_codon:yes gene_type:complete